jgi:bisanhydrobacterioruberin hydratase
LSAQAQAEPGGERRQTLRRAMLVFMLLLFALLWTGGVSLHWLGREEPNEGWFATLFLFVAGFIVLLGARTRRALLALLSVALVGFVVEVVGVRFRVPFGHYSYTDVLQPQLLGVPLALAPAWMTLVAFACDVTARLRLRGWSAAVIAALLTTATDLVIDPLAANQLGYWSWANAGSYYGIPLTNFGGWFVTALVGCLILGPRQQQNFWAGLMGTAVLLFFALIALAANSYMVALIGLALCAARLLLWSARRSKGASNSFRDGAGDRHAEAIVAAAPRREAS